LNAEGSLPCIRSGLELPAGIVVGTSHNMGVNCRIAGGVDPGAPRHTAGTLQRRAPSQIHVVPVAVEQERLAVFGRSGPLRTLDLARVAIAGRVGRSRTRAFIKG